MKSISIALELRKETKGTYRYENDDPNAVVSCFYVRKGAFEGKPPAAIRLVVEAGEA